MNVWLIPARYIAVSGLAGFILPRFEDAYLDRVHAMSVGVAIAFFSTVASGMMAMAAIVFAIAFVVVQFGALAYSPRLTETYVGNRRQYHVLGIFFATFTYSLQALTWTDRGASGTVPFYSTIIVGVLLLASMLAFARLIQSLDDLKIHNVLRSLGQQGREVIDTMFPSAADAATIESAPAPSALPPPMYPVTYSGEPRTITRIDTRALLRLAHDAEAVVTLECGAGETLFDGTVVMRVHGAARPIPERVLMGAIGLGTTRTFEQDPKYAIRLLVDIAIRGLSPAINDPTTAVQAIDQIEGLLRRLGSRQIDTQNLRDSAGTVRLTLLLPSWQDYLDLSFDEIRVFGAESVQVIRRLRAALTGLAEAVTLPDRGEAVLRYREHLDKGVRRTDLDDHDQAAALMEDRQGLGLARRKRDAIVVTDPG